MGCSPGTSLLWAVWALHTKQVKASRMPIKIWQKVGDLPVFPCDEGCANLVHAHIWCATFLRCAILAFRNFHQRVSNELICGEISVVLVLALTLCSVSVRNAGS
jgi:hypothetical protein